MSFDTHKGYTSNIRHNTDIFAAFTDPRATQAGNPVDAAMSSGQTVMAKISTQEHVSNLPGGTAQAGKVEGFKHQGNLDGMKTTAVADKQQIDKVAGGFEADVKQAQTVADAALKKACDNQGVSYGKAAMTIKPSPDTTHIGAGMGLGADMAVTGPLAVIGAAAQAVQDAVKDITKLKPHVVEKLIAEAVQMASPTKDEMGAVVKPPEIASNYNFDNIETDQDFKDIFRNWEDHEEGKVIVQAMKDNDENIKNIEYAEAHEHDNYGNKLDMAIEEGDQTQVAEIVGNEAEANVVLAEAENGGTLPPSTEIEYNSEAFFSSLAMTTPESFSADQDAKDAIATLNNEYNFKPELGATPDFTAGAAA